jgi:hypothetical protein
MCMLIKFLESRDVTFFENIFPMKKSYDMSSLLADVIADTTLEPFEKIDHVEHTPKPTHEEIDSEAPRRSNRPRIAKYFGDDFTVYLMDDEGTIFEICYSMDISKSFASSHPYKQGNLFPLVKLLCIISL